MKDILDIGMNKCRRIKKRMIPKQILDKWATAVVPKEAIFLKNKVAGVDQSKILHYEECGYRKDLVLWIAPKDCLRVEFESETKQNHRFILEMESAAKSLGFDYCITGHAGTSDYFNIFNIKGLPLGEDNQNAKLLLFDLLMPKMAKDELDRTNFGWTLSPVIEHEHWKPKYAGAIHKLIRGKNPLDHKNKLPKEILTKLNKAKKWYEGQINDIKISGSWVETFLTEYCTKYELPKGSRHFIIEKNLAAFLLFRKDKDLIKKRYYTMQGRAVDTMRTWEKAILSGKYAKVSPGELAKYIKDHSLNFKVPPIQLDNKYSKEKEEEQPQTSLIIDEEKEIMVEQIFDKVSKFCVYKHTTNEISYVDSYDDFVPIDGQEIVKKAIFLPTEALEYGTDEELDKEIKDFINKWLDIPKDVLQFALWNIKRSWVFDKFHTLNYLRALGDTGQGKSRFLDTLGYLHYKPIATSGATTSAPVFRIIDKWRGTLIIDEADFKKSDESQDIIKIINQGYEKGRNIMRCDQNDAAKISFFDPFCPKILATRRVFYDKAVESRCITQVMTGTTRKDINFNLNDDFFENAQKLRNKLLMWRFRNYFKINPNKDIDTSLKDLEPRVQQIVNSFISLFVNDKKQLETFNKFITNYQENLVDERRDSNEGQIIIALHELIEKGIVDISSKDIIEEGKLIDWKGNQMKPRALSSILKSLGFNKSVPKRLEEGTKRCIPLINEHLEQLFVRYGVTVVTLDTETSENKNKNENQNEKLVGAVPSNSVTTVTSVTEEQVQNDPPEIKFIQTFGKSGCQTQTFVEKWGEAKIQELLKNGDIYEKPAGILMVL